jgi:hypothetical protein
MSDQADDSRPFTAVGTAGDRGPRGRFLPGNRAARGNPANRRAQLIRLDLLALMGPDRRKAVALKLAAMAEAGDLQAIKELLDRTIGRPTTSDIEQRLERLESMHAANGNGRHG